MKNVIGKKFIVRPAGFSGSEYCFLLPQLTARQKWRWHISSHRRDGSFPQTVNLPREILTENRLSRGLVTFVSCSEAGMLAARTDGSNMNDSQIRLPPTAEEPRLHRRGCVSHLRSASGRTRQFLAVMYAVVLRPLPFPESARLVALWTQTESNP